MMICVTWFLELKTRQAQQMKQKCFSPVETSLLVTRISIDVENQMEREMSIVGSICRLCEDHAFISY